MLPPAIALSSHAPGRRSTKRLVQTEARLAASKETLRLTVQPYWLVGEPSNPERLLKVNIRIRAQDLDKMLAAKDQALSRSSD